MEIPRLYWRFFYVYFGYKIVWFYDNKGFFFMRSVYYLIRSSVRTEVYSVGSSRG